jgi:hypothetical protein
MSNISISISISIKECCRRLSVQGVLSYEELMVLSREVKLPWCGVKLEGCVGLLYNGGLYTQCGKVVEGEYCSRCKSKKESGKWNGSVSDRMNCKIGEYSVDGKNEISYMKWLSKNGISREMSEREASSRGLSIPLEHFVERERVRRGRKREPIVDPVVELVVEPVKKKRGRPRKEKSVSSNSEGEELIASLLKERKEQIEPESSSKKDDLGDSDEEETLVIKIEIDGKTYLKSKDNTVFDFMSHDELGIWNEKEQKIVVE